MTALASIAGAVLLCFFAASAHSQDQTRASPRCLILHGFNQDGNGAFKNSPWRLPGTRKPPCEHFPSLDLMQKRIRQLSSTEPLFISVVGHGLNGGVQCDRDFIVASRLLDALRGIAKTRKVGAHIQSCDSGELITKKIMTDELQPMHASVDQLCISTSSAPASSSYSGKSQFAKAFLGGKLRGISQEEAFRLHPESIKLISSAAWDDAGVPEVLIGSTTSNALRVLDRMQTIARDCPDPSLRSAATQCLVPNYSAAELNAVEIYATHGALIFSTQMQPEVMRAIADELLSLKLQSLQPLKNLGRWIDQKLKDQRSFTVEEFCRSFSPQTSLTNQQWAALSSRFMKKDAWPYPLPKKSGSAPDIRLICETLPVLIKKAQSSASSFEKSRPVHMAEIMSKVARESPTSKTERPLISTIMGIDNFACSINAGDEKTYRSISAFSSSDAIEAFVRGSIARSKFTSSMDQRRRNACRNFTL